MGACSKRRAWILRAGTPRPRCATSSWALTKQRVNGWFADCCLNDPTRPLTHTIGYALRGVIEGYPLLERR